MTQRTISSNKNEEDRKEIEDVFLKFAGVFEDDAEYWSSVEEKTSKNRNSHLITEED